jgi:hypothetical protein
MTPHRVRIVLDVEVETSWWSADCATGDTTDEHVAAQLEALAENYERRARLIRAARAIYDSVFPPADPVSEQQNKAPTSHTVSGANADISDGVLLS